MEVVVLGSGPSSAIPALRCVLHGTCAVCMEAHANPASRNRRLNPSLLVRVPARDVNILIDCGKTFREAVLRVFPSLHTSHVDAVVLTHGHADACLGLDDLREVQRSEEAIDQGTGAPVKTVREPMALHCSHATQRELGNKFTYLMEKPEERAQRERDHGKHTSRNVNADGQQQAQPQAKAAGVPLRWVAKLQWQLFDWFTPFQVAGMAMLPFPVVHGKGYLSSAFEFGKECGVRVVYISDVSELTDDARVYLNDPARPRIDLLVIDALYIDRKHATHMNLQDVVREVQTIRPVLTLLTGMSHDFDYATHSLMLEQVSQREGIRIEMAYDGWRTSFPLRTTQQAQENA